jgi:hypothetical protein
MPSISSWPTCFSSALFSRSCLPHKKIKLTVPHPNISNSDVSFDMEQLWMSLLLLLLPLPRQLVGYILVQLAQWIFRPKLWIIDLRTFRIYSVQIEHNAIRAIEFKRISPLGITSRSSEHWAHGLSVLDPGFRNTAVRQSCVTYMLVPKSFSSSWNHTANGSK